MAYYACYNSLYALLMKTGIKCEIHDCTLELMSFFGFNEEEKDFIKMLKKMRIDVQYYLKSAQGIEAIKVKSFVMHCKVLSKGLSSDEINEIRKRISQK